MADRLDPDEIAEIEKAFDEMREELRRLEEGQRVPFMALFPSGFMEEYTDAADIETFLSESGQFAPEDLASGGLHCTVCETGLESPGEVLGSEAFDRYIKAHSSFSSWEEMLTVAARRWLSRRLTPGSDG